MLKYFDFRSSPIVESSLTATLGVLTNPLSIESFKPKSDTIHEKSFTLCLPFHDALNGVADKS